MRLPKAQGSGPRTYRVSVYTDMLPCAAQGDGEVLPRCHLWNVVMVRWMCQAPSHFCDFAQAIPSPLEHLPLCKNRFLVLQDSAQT